MKEFLEKSYFNNTVKDYFISIAIILTGILLMAIFKRIAIGKLKKQSKVLQDIDESFAVRTVMRFALPALSLLIIYWGIHYLVLSEKTRRTVEIATSVAVAYFVLRLVSAILKHSLYAYVRKQLNGEEKVKQLTGIVFIMNMIIWGLGIVFLFDNLGYDVSAIITGLGIGGIAIALAAQNILGDLFNYFVIFFDRPFEVGDSITVDTKSGTVEHIGIKTTRIKSQSGEQLVFSNSDLTGSRIHNFKRMERRRVLFTFGVTYQTTPLQLAAIPKLVRSAIEEQSQVTFDRSHFFSFGEASLNFENVYYVISADYSKYMDIQQAINLKIMESLSKEGIEFAYMTRTIHEYKPPAKG